MDYSNLIVGIVTALSALLGTWFSNRKSQSLIEYRLKKLEEKVDLHNSVIERTYKLEEHSAVMDEKIKVANNRIADLEKGGGN